MGQLRTGKTYDKQIVTLARVMQLLREEQDIEVLITTTLDYLSSEFTYRLTWIGLYERLEHNLVGKGGEIPDHDEKFLKQSFAINSGDILEQLVIQQRPLAIPDLRKEIRAGEWQKVAQKFEIQGTLFFPLRCKDRCFGVVLLGSHLWGVSPREEEKCRLALLFGGLATALSQIEVERKYRTAKRPEQAIFQVIAEFHRNKTLTQRLEKVIALTHDFVAASQTDLYWYSAEKRYFWHRVGNQQKARSYRHQGLELRGEDIYDFYRLLANGQSVAISGERSPLKAESTKELLSRFKARSLLAAPIIVFEDLVGFLVVEDQEVRLWDTAERNFLKSVAQCLALVMGGEEIGTKYEQAKADVSFATDVTQNFARYDHPNMALSECARLLCQQLQISDFWLLRAGDDNKGELLMVSQSTITFPYSLFYYYSVAKRKQEPTESFPLHIKDWYQICQGSGTIAIDNLQADERLSASRKVLLKMGVQSLLACPIGSESNGGVLLLTDRVAHTWKASEVRMANFIAPQLSWVLKLNEQREDVNAIAIVQKTLQTGLTKLWETLDQTYFEQQWLAYLAQILDVPVAVLLTWTEEENPQAKPVSAVGTSQLDPNLTLRVEQDLLIQQTLKAETFYLSQQGEKECPWLTGIRVNQIVAFALQRPATSARGIILFTDLQKHRWPEALLSAIASLIQQFGQVRQHVQNHPLPSSGEAQTANILNWYKHRALEVLHRSAADSIAALLAIESQEAKNIDPEQSAQNMRQGKILRYLESAMTATLPIITAEKLQIIPQFTSISISEILKQSLRLVESHYQHKQLVTKFYNAGNCQISSDYIKLECVLFELLTLTGKRAPNNTQVEFWCRPLPSRNRKDELACLELSIIEQLVTPTENKSAEEKPTPPWLVSALSVQTTNANMKICQQMLNLLEGKLQFYQLKDQRHLSRLTLPINLD